MNASTASLGRGAPHRLVPAVRFGASPTWLYGYVGFQFACQLMLLIPEFNAIRVFVRSAAFLGSAALLVFMPSSSARRSTVKPWCYLILGVLLMSFLNPAGGGFVASVAQTALYTSILGPVFWISRIDLTVADFRRVIIMFWVFYTASAALGVLQVFFPGSFQPALSTVITDLGRDNVRSLEIHLSSGERVFRPMGLTDTPGGAAFGGLYALLLGMGIFQSRDAFSFARPLALASMLLGAMCLYLCQIRALIVMSGVCLLTMVAIQAFSGRVSRSLGAGLTLGSVIPLAFSSALSVGGRAVSDRLQTLTEQDPGSVYYSHRGKFLEYTIETLLPRYPLGAGLGRWGMVTRYFGNRSESIWVEIQWTGWLLDGGIPLILAYVAAICVTTYAAFRLATRRDGELNSWATLIVAYNVGAMALCFSYAVFIGTSGVEFWLLNAALLQAAHSEANQPGPATRSV